MMIDIFTHILPPKFWTALDSKAISTVHRELNAPAPALLDLDKRFRMMDRFEGLKQVLTVVNPPLEMVVDAKTAVELAKLANDEMAELIVKYPERFVSAAACLPMNDVDAALKEADRSVRELNFGGVQLFTPIDNKPLDRPEFMPLYEMMSDFDLPIWIHPTREPNTPDYMGEEKSRYSLFVSIGWPYETTKAMVRLVFSGIFDKYTNLKFITHHCGAMVPSLWTRLSTKRGGCEEGEGLKKPVEDYFKGFYADTALRGNVPGLMCGYAFFGEEHLVFGTDAPFGGEEVYAKNIAAIDKMSIPSTAKNKISSENAKRLLHISDG